MGTRLGLPDSSLGAIQIEHSTNGIVRQRHEMISRWLAYDTRASWSKLASALREMGSNTLAAKICDQYVPDGMLTIEIDT